MSERIALLFLFLMPGEHIGAIDHAAEMTYIANWTLPSLSPPMTRESMYDAKVVLFIQLYAATRRN
jgi:hypothetical protein